MVELNPTQFLGGPPPLGEILVSQGLLQKQQLDEALQYKDEHGLFLGQALVALRLVTEEDLVRALRSQQRFDAIHLTPDIVDPEVAAELGFEDCERFGCIPINRIAGHVTVAMEDPSDLLRIQELTGRIKSQVVPVFAEPRRIQEALRVHFGRTAAQLSPEELSNRIAKLAREASLRVAQANDRIETESEDPVVVELVEALLEEAASRGASALHVEPHSNGVSIRYRIGASLEERCAFPAERARQFVARLASLTGAGSDGRASHGRHRTELTGRAVELGFTAAPTSYGPSAVVEIVEAPERAASFEDNGLTSETAELLRALSDAKGVVLLAGTVRSGRSSLAAALLDSWADPCSKTIALDEGAEIDAPGVMQLDTHAFGGANAGAVRSALKMDADRLYVEELRDRQTAAITFQAARTGVRVLTSACTFDAFEALTRLRELGVSGSSVASTLHSIVGIRRVRRLCDACRVPLAPDAPELERLDESERTGTFHVQGEGCPTCRDTGFSGYTGLHEVLRLSDALRTAIQNGEVNARLESLAREAGWDGLRSSGLAACRDGRISFHDALGSTTADDH